MNTIRAEYVDRGMNHVEGGWAKDINVQDAEQTLRYRKKVEKDEEYTQTILQLSHVGVSKQFEGFNTVESFLYLIFRDLFRLWNITFSKIMP